MPELPSGASILCQLFKKIGCFFRPNWCIICMSSELLRVCKQLTEIEQKTFVSALPKNSEIPEAPATVEAAISPPPEVSIGQLLRDRRMMLGWTLEQASRKTGIPAQALQAIETMQLNLFINDAAKLERHIRVYANRLGQSLLGQDALIEKAKQIIRPKEVTQDLLDLLRLAR